MGIVHLVSLGTLTTMGMLLVGACNTTYLEQSRDEPQNAADIMRAADLRPRYPQPTPTVDTGGASHFSGCQPLRLPRRNPRGRRMSKL